MRSLTKQPQVCLVSCYRQTSITRTAPPTGARSNLATVRRFLSSRKLWPCIGIRRLCYTKVCEVFQMTTKRSYSAKAARKGKDIGKRGKNFSKIEAKAGRKYGSKAAGKRVAGAILSKQRAKGK